MFISSRPQCVDVNHKTYQKNSYESHYQILFGALLNLPPLWLLASESNHYVIQNHNIFKFYYFKKKDQKWWNNFPCHDGFLNTTAYHRPTSCMICLRIFWKYINLLNLLFMSEIFRIRCVIVFSWYLLVSIISRQCTWYICIYIYIYIYMGTCKEALHCCWVTSVLHQPIYINGVCWTVIINWTTSLCSCHLSSRQNSFQDQFAVNVSTSIPPSGQRLQ